MQKLQIFVSKYRERFRVGLLRNPRHIQDLIPGAGQRVAILTHPHTSTKAYEYLNIWEKRFKGPLRFLWWYAVAKPSLNFDHVDKRATLVDLLHRLKQVLVGRLLSEQRIMNLLRQEGFWPSDISRALDLGVHIGKLRQLPGFTMGLWGTQICTRCQSEEAKVVPCLMCGSLDCLLCLACGSMGEHRSCSTLFALQDNKIERSKESLVELVLDHELTPAQVGASQELLEFWTRAGGKALVWAACGAGKTEVTFPLIQRVLRSGGQVLFAIPRQDIVREMTERMGRAFPGVSVAAHYGGQPWFAQGSLVVATTHQVLHFYQRFQLAILDEVDAFPYLGNEMLRLGLKRALMPQGKLVEMTATPHSQADYEHVITIPARYHGFPLPEPELVTRSLPPWTVLKTTDIPPFLLDILEGQSHPWLIFAPTIQACTYLQKVLAKATERPVGLCHSKAKNRHETIQDLRDGRVDIVVTTSVLERGVNFPGVGVIVLYADHGIFTVSTLVQIAGRVGRTRELPGGTVIFMGKRATEPMKKALRLIKRLNNQARQRGLLYSESTS